MEVFSSQLVIKSFFFLCKIQKKPVLVFFSLSWTTDVMNSCAFSIVCQTVLQSSFWLRSRAALATFSVIKPCMRVTHCSSGQLPCTAGLSYIFTSTQSTSLVLFFHRPTLSFLSLLFLFLNLHIFSVKADAPSLSLFPGKQPPGHRFLLSKWAVSAGEICWLFLGATCLSSSSASASNLFFS